jgi:hypothetical protein
VPSMSEILSVPASISEDRYLPWFQISGERRPTSDFDWQGKLGGCLIRLLQLEKNPVARGLMMNSATCYTSVKLRFGVAWVQKTPAIITTSVPVKV